MDWFFFCANASYALILSFVINVRGYELPGRFMSLALLAPFPFNTYRVQKTNKQMKQMSVFYFSRFEKNISISMTKAVNNSDTKCSKWPLEENTAVRVRGLICLSFLRLVAGT